MELALENLTRKLVSGREIYQCDSLVPEPMIARIAELLKTLKYRRVERSRADAAVSGGSADIPDQLAQSEHFFDRLKGFAEQAFTLPRLSKVRLYVNCTVYGDMYYPHRDCRPDQNVITVLYYANPEWKADWGGETIFYNDEEEAEVVISPRGGRIVAFHGAILHRGGVPSRICYEERLTVAYKLAAVG